MVENQNISLPEKIEGKGVTVEEPEEKTKEEKERIEKQKEFEYKAKHQEPEEIERAKKQSLRDKIFKWVLLGVVAIGVAFLGFILL